MDTSKEVISSDDACMDTTNNESACMVASEKDIGDTLMDTSVTPDVKSSSGWEGISDCSSIEVISDPGSCNLALTFSCPGVIIGLQLMCLKIKIIYAVHTP